MKDRDMSDGRTASMTSDRLYQILESYGGAPAVWPEDERCAAQALISASPQARAMQEAALGLDGILDDLTPPAPSSELTARLESAGPCGTALHAAAPSKPVEWLRSLASLFGPQQWVPAALSLGGVALIAASLLLVGRGDDIEAPKPVAIASGAPAQDYLADMPLVDAGPADLSTDGSTSGELFAVLISARQNAFGSYDDPDALSNPWIELVSDDGQEGGFRLSAAPLSEIPLE